MTSGLVGIYSNFMSTNNFKFENILVVLPSFNYDYKKPCKCCKDEDCEYSELDSDFDQEGFKEYIADIQIKLEKIGFDSCEKRENDNNYCGQIIAEYGLQDEGGMIKYLQIVVRSGYYEGYNIDYTFDGEFDDEYNNKKNNDTMNRKVKQVAKILRKNGTEMLKVGQFSNGEAVYKLKK